MPQKKVPPPATVAQRNLLKVPVNKLLFDAENPRLASGVGPAASQDDLLNILWKEMAVDEVALSIAANGYFEEEPLFVIPKNPKETDETKKQYIVVEGNRRLAAVILLTDEEKREKVEATDLPSISSKRFKELEKLPVSIYKNREELWELFGFRHINGPKAWDAYSKAIYVANVHEQYDVRLDEIAKKIGDKHTTVKRLYRGYKILQQALKATQFSLDDVARGRFFFSHLYTAVDQLDFQRFLGITADNSLRANPVPKSNIRELGDLMLWLYGSKSAKKEPVVRSQNPDLNFLREVIRQPRGLSALRAGYSLERAYEISLGDDRRFREALTRGKEDLIQAKATVITGYRGEDDLYHTMNEITEVSASLLEDMETKRARPKPKQH